MKEFLISEENKLLNEKYIEENCEEIVINAKNKVCFIFFSSNGIYFPNTQDVFERVINIHNRYEWKNIAKDKNIVKIAGKYIFVRDIYKSWYVKGINQRASTIDSLVDYLKKKTKGYRIVTVGNSAGGYAATLVGALLNVEMVFNFSGQFSLWQHQDVVSTNRVLNKYQLDEEKNKYYDITRYINGETSIFYFYPAYCEQDIEQAGLVKKINNVYCFAFAGKKHGETMYPLNMPYILVLDKQCMLALYEKYKDRVIDRNIFLSKH